MKCCVLIFGGLNFSVRVFYSVYSIEKVISAITISKAYIMIVCSIQVLVHDPIKPSGLENLKVFGCFRRSKADDLTIIWNHWKMKNLSDKILFLLKEFELMNREVH